MRLLAQRNLIFPKVTLAAIEVARQENNVQTRLETISNLVLPDRYFDALFENLDDANTVSDLGKSGFLTKGQYVLLVLEWFRGDMLNGGFEQTLANKGWLMEDIIECLTIVNSKDLAQNIKGMMQNVEEEYAQFLSVPGDGRNSGWRKASREFSAQIRSKLEETPEGQFLHSFDNWLSQLEARLLSYFEKNLRDFCLEQ